MKKHFFLPIILLMTFVLTFAAKAEDLSLVKGRSYLLEFNEEVINFHADEKVLDAQLINTIFDDKKQLIISLKDSKETVLQVKTPNNYYKYNVKCSNKASDNVIEIDLPPLENIDVDIFEGV